MNMNMNTIPLTSLLQGSFGQLGQLSQQDLQTLMQSLVASAAAQEGRKEDEGESGEASGSMDAKNLAAALGQGMLAALPSNPAEWMMSNLMAGQVAAPTSTVDSLGDEPSETAGQSQGGGKARRAAWSAEEEARLVELANRYQAAGQRMCWRIIAQELATGRTSKQCREHYLNSLRPNMKKGQWTQKEEYVIAREHSRIGSHWCMIAKKLPGRTDNSIKNFYNATVRSKAVNKIDSFLWLYVTRVKTGMAPKDAFDEAQTVWTAHASPAVVQEVMAAEDGAEALMLLADPKPKGLGATGLLAAAGLQGLSGMDAHTIESLLAQVQSNQQSMLQSQALAPAQLQELLAAGTKRERPDAGQGDMTALLTGAADSSDVKRAKLLQDMAGGSLPNLPGNTQALSRQDFLQQLGLTYNSDPQQQTQQQTVVTQQSQQPQQPMSDMSVLQQQLQLTALLQAAAQSGQPLPTLSQITGQQGNAVPMNLSLLNQLTGGQGVLLGSAQQPVQAAANAAAQVVSNGGAGGTMMSLLGVDGGANAAAANGDGGHEVGHATHAELLQHQQMGHVQQQQQQRQAEQAAQQVVLANAHHQVVLQQQQQHPQQPQHVGHYQLVTGYEGIQGAEQARLVKAEDGTMVSLDPAMLAQLGDLANLPASALGLQMQPVSVVQLSAADAAAMQAAGLQQHQ